jgi:hypothetical protein
MSAAASDPAPVERTPMSPTLRLVAVVAWLWVLIPLAYGLYQLIVKIPALFG